MNYFVIGIVAAIAITGWFYPNATQNFSGTKTAIFQGGTGTSTAPSGQLLYGGGAGVYQSVATTSASCSSGTSCTSFAVLGSSPVTITGTGLSSYDAFTHTTPTNSATTSRLGLSTTTPSGSLAIGGTVAVIPFIISTTTPTLASSTLFMIDQSGDAHFGGGVPALSSCGTAPFLDANSTDQAGTVTFGASASACTITFSVSKKSSPHCLISTRAVSLVNAYTITQSASAFTITQAASGGTVWDYFCPLGH